MDVFIRCLTFVLITLTVNGLAVYMRKHGKATENSVTLPKAIRWVGIICGAFFAVILLAVILTNGPLWTLAVFGILALLSASLIIASVNCRITYGAEGFDVKNFWGKTSRYTYGDITGIHGRTRDVTVFMGKNVARVDEIAVGREEFLAYIKLQYRKLHQGADIPEVKVKYDLFNGNVENAGQLLVGYGICLGIMLVLFVMIAVSSNRQYETKTAMVSFVSYETQDKELRLYTAGDETCYSISAYRKCMEKPEQFLIACEIGMQFQIRYEIRDSRYSLCSIVGQNGTVYLTEEAVSAYRNRNAATACWIIGGGFVLICLWMVGSVYVGRHPEKFSKKVIRLFFRDGYIRDVSKTT